ncbi:MAG: LysR family transcriptional regulator [Beijerinckiaceae bacterium]
MRLEDLDFGKLRAFQIVADQGSLRAAALKLRLTPSAISAKLARLEEIVGVRLFDRGPKSLTLTPAGQRLRAEIAPILDMTEQAMGRVASDSDEAGSVSIAVGGDYVWYFVPRLNQFWTRFPNVQVNMRVYRSSQALAALERGDIDFCMGFYSRIPPGLRATEVERTPFSLIYQGEGAARPRIGDIVRDRLIVAPRGSATRRLVKEANGVFPEGKRTLVECPTCQSAIELVHRDAGPALVHTICVEGRLPQGLQRLDLGEDFASIPFLVLYRPSVMDRAPTRFILEQFAG